MTSRRNSRATHRKLDPPPPRIDSPPHLADLGRLWYDDEIAAHFFRDRVTVRWVREHLPRATGLKIGRQWAWYETDIVTWITSRRGVPRAGP